MVCSIFSVSIIQSLKQESDMAKKSSSVANESVIIGVKSVEETNDVFKDIVNMVDGIYEANSFIESSVNEQSKTIAMTNDNSQIIASGVKESNRAVSEITDTLNDLQKKLEELTFMIDKFIT